MTLDLEEHFWARPSSSKVGTELAKVGTELSKVGTELTKVGTELILLIDVIDVLTLVVSDMTG